MARKPFRTQWVHRDEPAPAPVSSHMEKAKRLPLPGPGIVVTVPLHLLMDYLALHNLKSDGIQEPKVPRRDGPGEAILLVKRQEKEGENDQTKQV